MTFPSLLVVIRSGLFPFSTLKDLTWHFMFANYLVLYISPCVDLNHDVDDDDDEGKGQIKE